MAAITHNEVLYKMQPGFTGILNPGLPRPYLGALHCFGEQVGDQPGFSIGHYIDRSASNFVSIKAVALVFVQKFGKLGLITNTA